MNKLGGWIFGAIVVGFFVLVFAASRPPRCPDEGLCRAVFQRLSVERDDELYCEFQPGRLLREYELTGDLDGARSVILANAAPYAAGALWETRQNLQFAAPEYLLRLRSGPDVYQVAMIGPNNEDDDPTLCLTVLE